MSQPTPDPEQQRLERQKELESLQAWLDWARSLSVLLGSLSRLFNAEINLAVSDLKRLLILALLALPLALLSWLGFSALVAWGAYAVTDWPSAGFGAFFLLQTGVLLLLLSLIRRYQQSLGLPRTREQLSAIIRDFGNGPQDADRTNPPG